MLLGYLVLLAVTIGSISGSFRERLWIEAAKRYLLQARCEEDSHEIYFHDFIIPGGDCRALKGGNSSEMNVYTVEWAGRRRKRRLPGGLWRGGRLISHLPDKSLSGSRKHQGVLVIDPFPSAPFGHLVLIFFIDPHSINHCRLFYNGIYLENGDCLIPATKRGCRRRNFGKAEGCSFDFIPTVYESNARTAEHRKNVLQCHQHPHFAPCPEPSVDSFATTNQHPPLLNEVSCQGMEACDHAIIVQGGWNSVYSRSEDYTLMLEAWNLFSRLRYAESNIQLFYKNGIAGNDLNVQPAVEKKRLRYRIRNLCRTHCVDSLALLLRGPALRNGGLLLWDMDRNGKAESEEVYTAREVLEDIAGCGSQVNLVVLADFSYSAILEELVRLEPEKYPNLQLLTSTRWDDASSVPLGRELSREDHTLTCIDSFAKNEQSRGKLSYYQGSSANKHLTLYGAVCNETEPLSAYRRLKSLGCQTYSTYDYIQRSERIYTTPQHK